MKITRTSLGVQWLRLHVTDAEDLGSIPGQRTRSHGLQLKVPHASTGDPECCKKIRDPVYPTKASCNQKKIKGNCKNITKRIKQTN